MDVSLSSIKKDENKGMLKRSSREKRQKKFFDEGTKTKPSFKVKFKPMVKIADINRQLTINDSATTCSKEKDIKTTSKIDDEDAWLEALEKGELDDKGDLPRRKDPLLTARQRAKLDRNDNLIEEVVSPKEELTEEQKLKKDEKNRKRKLQAVKRAEDNKNQTIKKLVEGIRQNKLKSITQNNQSMIKYKCTTNEWSLSYPEGYNYPLKAMLPKTVPKLIYCEICNSPKRYNCSKTGVNLCSLKCYKINLSNLS